MKVETMVKEKDTKNGEFSSYDEIKYMNINRYLKIYETNIESIFKEKKYYKIIIDGTNIIELLLEIFLTRENDPTNKPTSMIEHAIKTNCIPIKIKTVLFEINQITSEINNENTDYKKTHKFLKSFKKFILWFNNLDNESNMLIIDNCIKLIDNLPNTELNENNIMNEDNYITKINESLKNLEKYLKLASKDNYVGAVVEGYNVCNLMLELFLKNEGYTVNDRAVVLNNKKIPVISFCIQKDTFPKECREFLQVIYEYNEFFKSDTSYNLALTFLNGLCYFMLWFNNFYSEKYSITKPFKIENCYGEIIKLTRLQNDDEEIFKSKSSKTKKHKSEIANTDMNGLQINFSNNINNFDLEQGINIITEVIKNHVSEEMQKTRETIEESKETILTNLNEIKKEIKNISLKITDYQSLIERQINNFDSDEVKDRIISAFADECAERIINETHFEKDDDSYNLEKTSLIQTLGEGAWSKLSEESQIYLISSKLMFNNLNNMRDVVDYSGVCILVTKALEVELYKRFFDNFLKYLDQKRYKKYDNYPTGLLYKNKEPLNEDKFNLGTVAYIFCLKRDYYLDYYQEKNNEEKLIEYCEADLFNEFETTKIEKLIKKFGKNIEEIRKKYRNPSAHRNKITIDNAEECLNLVLYNDNPLLKEMLDSFKK